jgi:hypothetical protein
VPDALRPLLADRRLRASVARRLGLPTSTVLGDLDQGVWLDQPREAVHQLANEVVVALRQVDCNAVSAVNVFASRPQFEVLDLTVRSRNALLFGRLVKSGRMTPTTVGALLQLRNFGAVSLLDVLTVDEALTSRPSSKDDAKRTSLPHSRAVRKAASALARRRWSSKVSCTDPRLGDTLLTLAPSARTARDAAQSLTDRFVPPDEVRRTTSLIREFSAAGDALRRLTLEEELDQIVGALTPRPSAKAAVLLRKGLGGSERMTLDQAGRAVGVTRERVRQIEKRFDERVEARDEIYAPVLDRALRMAADMVPTSASALESALLSSSLVAHAFSAGSLISAAESLGKEMPFAVAKGGPLVPLGDWAPSSAVRSAASRLVEHWGATTIAEVELRLRDKGFEVDSSLLLIDLEALTNFRWLDQERGWFWIRGTRNRLLNQAEKILSVAGSIDIGELRAGVGRPHRMKGFRPPRGVLAALCVDSGLYRREGDRVVGNADLRDWRDVLGNNERLLVDVLFDFGPVMRREDLEGIVVGERGLNRSSFYVYLTYAPMIERYAPGVYGLRGAPVTAAEVDAMIPERVRHQVLQDHGWTADGKIWAAFRVSPASESTGILGAPSAFRSVTSGKFELVAEDESHAGTLTIEHNMWGLTPFFRRRGVEVGDYVVIALDLGERRATITVGTEELLLRYQAGE